MLDYLIGVRLILQYIGLGLTYKKLGLPYWTAIEFVITWNWIEEIN